LELVLNSFRNQTEKNYELIIADDGSTSETKDLIEKYRNRLNVPLIHLWQEDDGFRKAQIHNEAIRVAKSDFLIFTDGDCVVDPDFVKDHRAIYDQKHSEDYVFMGRRVEVGQKLTEELTPKNQNSILCPWSPRLAESCLESDSRNFFRSFSIKNPIIRYLFKSDKVDDLLGCNFSLPKRVMENINGFNENFKTYWGEDGDIFVRLRNFGCELIGAKSYAVQYHLYHSRRTPGEGAMAEYNQLLNNREYKWTEKGLKQ